MAVASWPNRKGDASSPSPPDPGSRGRSGWPWRQFSVGKRLNSRPNGEVPGKRRTCSSKRCVRDWLDGGGRKRGEPQARVAALRPYRRLRCGKLHPGPRLAVEAVRAGCYYDHKRFTKARKVSRTTHRGPKFALSGRARGVQASDGTTIPTRTRLRRWETSASSTFPSHATRRTLVISERCMWSCACEGAKLDRDDRKQVRHVETFPRVTLGAAARRLSCRIIQTEFVHETVRTHLGLWPLPSAAAGSDRRCSLAVTHSSCCHQRRRQVALLPGAGRAPAPSSRGRLTADRAHKEPGGRHAQRRPGRDGQQQSDRGRPAPPSCAPSTSARADCSTSPRAPGHGRVPRAPATRAAGFVAVDEAHCSASGGTTSAGVRQSASCATRVSRARRSTPTRPRRRRR